MDFNIGGNYEHYGDNIEDGGRKIVYNGDNPSTILMTKKELKRKIDAIRHRIKSDRMWFSVCKYMMWHHMCAEMNFKDACGILMELYPDLCLDYTKIKELNVGSLKGELEDWKYECGEPFKEEETFEQYRFIAKLMDYV